MKSLGPIRYALSSCMAAALLAGCGVLQPPIEAPAAMPQTSATATRPERGHSPMSVGAKRDALLYASDYATGKVYVYSYPDLQLKLTLTGLNQPEGLCVDATGNVWVVETGARKIVEYAHGGITPIATQKNPGEESPRACAVNPKDGDLAVTSVGGDSPGFIAIFRGAHGKPTVYGDVRIFAPLSVAYDDRGDVFVDGSEPNSKFGYAELPSGGKKFTTIKLIGATIKHPGGVQYANGNIAVGDDQRESVIYQTTGATVTGSTPLKGACHDSQFFIDGSAVVVPSACNHHHAGVLLYAYPAGGSPIKSITGPSLPIGVTISN
jgi:hypothetical protein